MLDQSLEQKLRAALRTEGDDLPLTITAAELERRLALRRRGGLSPLTSLGLAAAVGIGLLGLVAVAGGWLEQRPATVPNPSASAGPTPVAALPAPSVAAVLPTLDDLLGPLDPATIVHAQTVGPADAPPVRAFDPADQAATGTTMDFSPVVRAGVDRLWTACLGPAQLDIEIRTAGSADPHEAIGITCDGSVTSHQVGLETGDTIGLRSATPVSWRFVDEARGQPVPDASSIPDVIEAPAGDETLLDATSADDRAVAPDVDPSTGLATWSIGGLPVRAGYRVTVACAGPRPVRYRIGGIDPGPAPDATTLTSVACDGAAHQDGLDLVMATGTDVAVVADPRDSWQILVTADRPPFAIPENGGGWEMSSALGPSYFTDAVPVMTSLVGGDGPVRVVINCAGATTVTGTIEIGVPVPSRPDPFTIDCSAQPTGATLERIYPRGANQVTIVTDPLGATIWLAVTTQTRSPTKAAP
jgi:hypothetical protein